MQGLFIFITDYQLLLVRHDAPSGCVPEIVVLIAGSACTYPDQMMSKYGSYNGTRNR